MWSQLSHFHHKNGCCLGCRSTACLSKTHGSLLTDVCLVLEHRRYLLLCRHSSKLCPRTGALSSQCGPSVCSAACLLCLSLPLASCAHCHLIKNRVAVVLGIKGRVTITPRLRSCNWFNPNYTVSDLEGHRLRHLPAVGGAAR